MSSLTDPTDLREAIDIVIGVDTHVATHTAAAVDARTGGIVDQITVDSTAEGYSALVEFADTHGVLRMWAIEGTSSHGAGLTRHLAERDEVIVELDRPVRAKRRNGAKSDALDAVRAAREALARPQLGTPKTGGDRQALSVLVAVRRSAVLAAADARRQLFSLVMTAPEPIRAKFRGAAGMRLVAIAAGLRIQSSWDTETSTTVVALRSLARRVKDLTDEAAVHEHAIAQLVQGWRPDLVAQPGIGPITAAVILCAWSHPGRVRSEAAFAMLAGVAPIPANSGQTTTRWRLNRAGDRQLNCALHTIAMSRIRYDDRTRDYIERRTAQGKTTREARRCLKRYIARDLYRLLEHPPQRP